jgi:hypothetical protein
MVVLVRLDLGGAPHRNPFDEEIGVPHLHLYREGFGDKIIDVAEFRGQTRCRLRAGV